MNDYSKIIIVGATGYIGKQLHVRAIINSEVYGTSLTGEDGLNRLQLSAPDEFNYGIIQPSDTVVVTAAISAPDICAQEHDRAWAVNVTGTSEFIAKVIARGGRVIFFSSDTVYGDKDNIFDEFAVCNPAGEYAEMKHQVEKRFLGNPLFKSIRLSYVFSAEDKFTKYLEGCASRFEVARVYHPFSRSVIHRDDVVDGALALAQRWDGIPQQVINFGGPHVISRWEFAKQFKDVYAPALKYEIFEPDEEFFRNRPRTIAMASNILPSLLGRPARTLIDAMQIEFKKS